MQKRREVSFTKSGKKTQRVSIALNKKKIIAPLTFTAIRMFLRLGLSSF
ncbi:hypothetical protein wVul_0669 [Wolbachia endosymbiont of Armadillidium vulgare str. wVulC]|nr:hypothetical protein wVul_0669 [Wolbachia endosymbiont of Armadillidium vulgare str. wVulC]